MYDVIVIGSGPGGIFSALELVKKNPKLRVALIEKGEDLEVRVQKIKDDPTHCIYGFSGAGAFSDGKLTLTTDVGGHLAEHVGRLEADELVKYVDNMWREHGAPDDLSGATPDVLEIQKRALIHGVKFIPFPVRHMGTDNNVTIMANMRRTLKEHGVDIFCNTPCTDVFSRNGNFVVQSRELEFTGRNLIVGVGRGGSNWIKKTFLKNFPLAISNNYVDIGVRVEFPRTVFDNITNVIHDPKFIYHTKANDDKVRTFCVNPGGYVSLEYNEDGNDGFYTVNGHSEKHKKTQLTNFALLTSVKFTEPFDDPITYGKNIAKLSNLLGGKVIMQRWVDLMAGRRSTKERINRSLIPPSLPEATPGDLSFVIPHRQMQGIIETLQVLDKISPGILSDQTMLYGVEVKFYSIRFALNKDMETNIPGLFIVGDGSGLTRGLVQASCSGVLAARGVMKKTEKKADPIMVSIKT